MRKKNNSMYNGSDANQPNKMNFQINNKKK